MDLGTVLSVAQTFFAALQCSELKDLCSILRNKSDLDNLKQTVDTVKSMLDDAESMQDQMPHLGQARLYIDQLKDVVYDAEDLFDEFITLAELKKLTKSGNVSQKVRPLFSCFNYLDVARKTTQRVKEITDKFDAIASNHNNFSFKLDNINFKLDCEPTRKRRDTCSFEHTQDIIGRKDDVEKIVGRLLDSNVQRDVSCLTIVGLGGLGKTALAQLVYNDPRIEKEFPLRLWTCVSDEDKKDLDVRGILCRILELIIEGNHKDLELERLQKQLREQLVGKKFFLVLDDVWNEDRLQWLNLEKFLKSGPSGSWILVTTRSEETATAIGDKHPYKLKGLSDEDSWHLFEIMAFGQMDKQAYSSDLEEIGRDIVKRCANVPLAIKVVGSLLYGHGKDKWISFQKVELGRLGKISGIEPILKLSYHHLESPLKTCFRYCGIFPKDHTLNKEMLMNLWMAQDYVAPIQEGQSIEDAAEEYFSILVKRCFFQDVEKDEDGNIFACKIHDLMHDVAQEIAGMEVYTTNFIKTSLDNKIRHLSYASMYVGSKSSFTKTKVRTCLHIGQWEEKRIIVDPLLRNWQCLRTLSLRASRIKSLPSALGKLLHLRFLDLSYNPELKMLPKSTTKLYNLQTLNLQECSRLKELPLDLPNLVKLRILDICGCYKLNNMPRAMGKLSCLQKLPMFILGDRNSILKHNVVDQMKDLKALVNLKGRLYIEMLSNSVYAVGDAREGEYIRNKEHLNGVFIEFPGRDNMVDYEQELLLDDLQPHHNLKELKLRNYQGMRMPSWAREDHLETVLPNLVKIELDDCGRLQHLASLRKLRHLKLLRVEYMYELEYIESRTSNGIMNDGAQASGSETFFPSLKQLYLKDLPKLKGWWRYDDTNGGHEPCLLQSFPSLSVLDIRDCPNLTCVPTCPTIEELELHGELNEKLRIMNGNAIEYGNFKLRKVSATNAESLKWALPIEAFQCLHEMTIIEDKEIESLSQVEEVFRSCCSSLQRLFIRLCPKLKSVCGGLEHLTVLEDLQLINLRNLHLSNSGEREGEGEEDDGMPWRCLHQSLRSLKLDGLPKMVNLPKGLGYLTALQSLEIWSCEEFTMGEREEDDGMPWRCLHHSLHSLTLWNLPKMVNLPKGMRYLTALQSLIIHYCKGLESLPESMRELNSLQTLHISSCSEGLRERCEDHTGQDWPKIQHIPRRDICKY